ncbi:hypothetical protein F4780DRAFT_769523 [Xylariomycetidae sp. FL0641]|nr:hypothetical protein F4780DRAFT_769523 [Xylariomycetidae sp. FL0641]
MAGVLPTPASPVAHTQGSLMPLACALLNASFPSQTFFAGHEIYTYDAGAMWSNTQRAQPGCVFRPKCALDVSAAVRAARSSGTPFAVRGGGHMGVPGANNIGAEGVLVVFSNMVDMRLSASPERTVLQLAPGLRWGDVYAFLEPRSLAVAGGRLGPVGVPGLLLAGGISFYGNQAGWSADNVVEYEVVLADGRVVLANSAHNVDLFWALKGGGNNFGIVTRFTLRTFASAGIWAGMRTVPGTHMPAFLAAVADYAAHNDDPRSHIVPMLIPMGPGQLFASVILYHDSDIGTSPPCFDAFMALPAVQSTVGRTTLAAYAYENGALVREGINDLFIAGTTVGIDYDSLLRGLQITADIFLAALPRLYSVVPPENLSLVSIDWQPVGAMWQGGSKNANPAGNPLGVDPSKKGTYLAWAEVVEWVGSEYDDAVIAWVAETTNLIEEATKAAGIHDGFTYMGDAAGFQKDDVYPGYGEPNRMKLLEISRQYDPERVLQGLWPGGFKLGY